MPKRVVSIQHERRISRSWMSLTRFAQYCLTTSDRFSFRYVRQKFDCNSYTPSSTSWAYHSSPLIRQHPPRRPATLTFTGLLRLTLVNVPLSGRPNRSQGLSRGRRLVESQWNRSDRNGSPTHSPRQFIAGCKTKAQCSRARAGGSQTWTRSTWR